MTASVPLICEVENEADDRTFEADKAATLGNFDDYATLVREQSAIVRENIPGVEIYAGGLRAYGPEDLAYYLASDPASDIDKLTVHHGNMNGLLKSVAALTDLEWPSHRIILGESWAQDTSDQAQVEVLEQALRAGIVNCGGAAVLGICSSIYRWGNVPKTFQLGAWGEGGRLDSALMRDMLIRVAAVAKQRGQRLWSMWGEEYADGNEDAARFAHEHGIGCRLGISTQFFDNMFKLNWSVERCLDTYPALFTNRTVSCLEVIERATALWVVLDGSNHGEFDGRYYHRNHLGFDPRLPADRPQVYAQTLAPYYNSRDNQGKMRTVVLELSKFLGSAVVEPPIDPPVPVPPDPADNRQQKKWDLMTGVNSEKSWMRALVNGTSATANNWHDELQKRLAALERLDGRAG